ncbi:uncharacterized protein LAESUDRAFT_728377 [Laetiporus sulphureus 93-53]|uniref:Uncharacterized protein n=1 Tax=Laetiporus sulphureus 93-53 TaxID=1314785 RepID=A0A165D4Y6_9APHY|nr:uncharacterized protein LAESUDRAFT_728377 [Laetiporus sulphureus 93-53]KZT04161.1 hypothetical protein LAESUDRAFT_728377 [Laetiporus sulphureus 93-53]
MKAEFLSRQHRARTYTRLLISSRAPNANYYDKISPDDDRSPCMSRGGVSCEIGISFGDAVTYSHVFLHQNIE